MSSEHEDENGAMSISDDFLDLTPQSSDINGTAPDSADDLFDNMLNAADDPSYDSQIQNYDSFEGVSVRTASIRSEPNEGASDDIFAAFDDDNQSYDSPDVLTEEHLRLFLESLSDDQRALFPAETSLQTYIDAFTPVAPKRPMSGYFLFVQASRDAYKQTHPDASVAQITKALAVEWGALSDEEKRPYDEQVAEAKARYEAALESYSARKALYDRACKFRVDTLGLSAEEPDGASALLDVLPVARIKSILSLDSEQCHLSKPALSLICNSVEAFVQYMGHACAQYSKKFEKKHIKNDVLRLMVRMQPALGFLRGADFIFDGGADRPGPDEQDDAEAKPSKARTKATKPSAMHGAILKSLQQGGEQNLFDFAPGGDVFEDAPAAKKPAAKKRKAPAAASTKAKAKAKSKSKSKAAADSDVEEVSAGEEAGGAQYLSGDEGEEAPKPRARKASSGKKAAKEPKEPKEKSSKSKKAAVSEEATAKNKGVLMGLLQRQEALVAQQVAELGGEDQFRERLQQIEAFASSPVVTKRKGKASSAKAAAAGDDDDVIDGSKPVKTRKPRKKKATEEEDTMVITDSYGNQIILDRDGNEVSEDNPGDASDRSDGPVSRKRKVVSDDEEEEEEEETVRDHQKRLIETDSDAGSAEISDIDQSEAEDDEPVEKRYLSESEDEILRPPKRSKSMKASFRAFMGK
jgi:hypothetical protein